MLSAERNEYRTINFEETELRLGLPGGGSGESSDQAVARNHNGKRGFSETEGESSSSAVDLKLNLSTSSTPNDSKVDQVVGGVVDHQKLIQEKVVAANPPAKAQSVGWPPVRSSQVVAAKPPAKAQVVGWPPVRSFRKNIVAVQKKSTDEEQADQKAGNSSITSAAFVKVSMDGAPYLRKVDLKLYESYQELSDALGKMFSSFTIGNCGSQGMKDFMNESKLIDLLNGSEYVATYEDRDGDWMLVGDVPWEMFVKSCKRLRIMKGSEAIGLAPRAVEKCKNRS